MVEALLTITGNEPIAEQVYRMTLSGDTGAMFAGQFVNIKLEGFYLRRPISVCDIDDDKLTLIYKAVGDGTKQMSGLKSGEKLSVMCGLGNGFKPQEHSKQLLIAGGVGAPPMLLLAKSLAEKGIKPTAVLGFRSANDVFLEKELAHFCEKVYITTEDGSHGTKGFVTTVVNDLDFDYFYACGPLPMLRALSDIDRDGQLSYEERMGCGFGGCMGCSCEKENGGYARICKEGPVFNNGELKL